MTFVIVNVGTEMTYRKRGHVVSMTYPTTRGAKIACTKLNKQYGNTTQWVVMSTEDYEQAHPVKMVERTNLMTGKKFSEPANTPLCCSPASETYWSM